MNPDDLPSLEELAALLPQYRFECLIAEGGMGAVYRAEQISLGRPVAIKILPRSLTADAVYREQFKTEARLMGSLNYPHIVNIHDFGEAGDVLFIVMELLEGTNLFQRMSGEPLRQPDIVKVMSQVCDALTAAHHKGVIHRDVKPENIFIEPGLRVKLGDFGIARQRRAEADTAPQAAVTGVRLGTPEYAAPELFDFNKHIDHRADIFSLGVVLYELLTGARPTGSFMAPSKRKPGVDRRFDDVVIRAMQSDPNDRYANAEEMRKELMRIVSQVAQPAARAAAAMPAATGQKGARPAPVAAPLPQKKPTAALPEEKRKETRTKLKKPAPKRSQAWLWGGVGGAAALVLLVIIVQGKGGRKGSSQSSEAGAQLDRLLNGDPSGSGPAIQSSPPAPSPEKVSPPTPPLQEPPAPAAKITAAGHTYQFIRSGLSWHDAKAAAEKLGGHLACVTSAEEYDALREYLLPLLTTENAACWLGASDEENEGEWKWITGEPFDFIKWASGAPSDSQGGQDFLAWHCQSKYGDRRIEWNDVSGPSEARSGGGYLVEWEK
jgi:hypothetical protein